MVAPIGSSMMLVGGSQYGQLDAAFDELTQSVALGASHPLFLAPGCFFQSPAYSFGASTGDISDCPAPTCAMWAAASGGSGSYASVPSGQMTRDSGTQQRPPCPQYSVAGAEGLIEVAGMGAANSYVSTRVNYELPLVASTMHATSMYGVCTRLTNDGGDAFDYGSPSSSGSQSNCYSACSPSSGDALIFSTPPIQCVPADVYTSPSESDSFLYSSADHEMPVAFIVGQSSPEYEHDAATGCPHSSPEHETAYFGCESYSSPETWPR